MQHSNLAKGLASLGRGEDSMLVHMTPKEVESLQTIAMSHGGSLTVNPHTGLPEAGFLSKILPMLAGGLGTLLTGGAINPLTMGLITGAGTGLATGDVKKGLLAGLGAYGGASLLSGLAGASAAAPVSSVGGAAGTTAGTAGAGAGAGVGTGGAGASLSSTVQTLPPVPPFASGTQLVNGVANLTPASTGLTPGFSNFGANLSNVGTGAKSLFTEGLSGFNPSGYGTDVLGTGAKALGLSGAASAAPFLDMGTQTGLPSGLGLDDSQADMIVPEFELVDEGADPFNQANFDVGGYREHFRNQRMVRRSAEGGITNLSGGGVAKYELGGTTTAPAPTTTTTAPAPTTTTTAPVKPNWLGAQAKGMPKGFYNIRPNLFPFYRFRGQQDAPGYGIYTPGSPRLTSWNNPMGQQVTGIRNMGQVINRFGQSSPFGQELLRRGSAGLNYRFPYDTEKYGIQQYGYIPPDVTPQMYNQQMREIARQYMGTPNAFVAYWNPELTPSFASGGLASFAAGGRPGVTQPGGYLDGDGDGMSDSIPATIANKQPARLADGEFVVSADVVSGLGNGSTKAGAKQLYAMMDRVRQARTGTTQQGKQINPNKLMPA